MKESNKETVDKVIQNLDDGDVNNEEEIKY